MSEVHLLISLGKVSSIGQTVRVCDRRVPKAEDAAVVEAMSLPSGGSDTVAWADSGAGHARTEPGARRERSWRCAEEDRACWEGVSALTAGGEGRSQMRSAGEVKGP